MGAKQRQREGGVMLGPLRNYIARIAEESGEGTAEVVAEAAAVFFAGLVFFAGAAFLAAVGGGS